MEENTKKGYGKRPTWQWILIYLIIGGFVYWAIYYFVFANQGGYSTSESAPIEQQQGYP